MTAFLFAFILIGLEPARCGLRHMEQVDATARPSGDACIIVPLAAQNITHVTERPQGVPNGIAGSLDQYITVRPSHIDRTEHVKWDGQKWAVTKVQTFDRKKAKWATIAYAGALAFDLITTTRGWKGGDLNPIAQFAFRRGPVAGWSIMTGINVLGVWQAWKHKDSNYLWIGAGYHAGLGAWNLAQQEE